MRPRKLLHRLRAGNHDNVRFADLQALMAACGYELDRISGSGQAKPYQLRQLLDELDRYDLNVEEDR